mgnify:FL=1|tara:strand:+ start:20219 stop:20440 length:222 start_codon:yes stop_codon:yes gene_type:complete
MAYLKIEGHEGYVKDPNTGVVLNVNQEEINGAKTRRALRKQQEEDINNLKNEVSDIKNMLGKIIEKLDGNNSN